MSIVPKDSVRFQVALAVLVMIGLSWVLSTGLANYANYVGTMSVRQEMLRHPELYPRPVPEPQFGISDFLLGRPPRSADRAAPTPSNFLTPMELRWVLLRLAIALTLAVLAAVWIGRKLTRPLTELADGARAFHSRDYSYRVPTEGKSEFTAVATAMNEMAEEVSGHIRSLEEDAARRRQFLADVAHELRSPITTMRTMAGALQDGTAHEPERRERAVSVLVRTSERMFRLVQDVMELVELDLDRLPINRSEVDLRSLVAAVMASRESEAEKAGVILESVELGPRVIANVDSDRITQALDNIIGNAISYAGSGATVSVSIQDGNPIRLAVTDTGVGIPAKDLPHITDSFYRVSAARTPGDNHIGLGLSIARRLLEAHGGKLTVASEEGRRTSVTLLIPRFLT